jgi:cytochrome c biogenesis protein CcmG, thiol:disulfide interchange protein DsbE
MKTRNVSRVTVPLIGTIFVAIVLGACGDQAGVESPKHFMSASKLPEKLAPLRSEANELLPGGESAFRSRLSAVRGYPVVVTKWASWCNPCIGEMPILSQAANQLSKKVAFIGVNSEDSEKHAMELLADTPIPYPSYSDPDRSVANVFTGGTTYMPATGFYDRKGDLIGVKYGPFSSIEDVLDEVEDEFDIAPVR